MKLLVGSNIYPSKDYPSLGVFVKNFCDELDQLNINYDAVLMNLKKGKVNKLFSYISYFSKLAFKGLFKKYDVLYIHYVSHNALPALLIKFFRRNIKMYVNTHGSDVIPNTNLQKKMQKYVAKLLDKADKVVVPSNYFKGVVKEKFNLKDEKIYMYPSGGIDKEIFYPQQLDKEIYEKYGLNPDRKYIGNVSRIAQGKGWDTFVEAFKKIAENPAFNEYDAVIVGRGEQKQDFLKMIETYGLKDRIVYIEQVPQKELGIIYNLIEVFVFSTKANESLGLVGIEAMATKTNIIASDYAAPKYIIDDGVNGLKFEVGNSDHLYETIIKYFSLDESEKEKLSENAYSTAQQYYRENIRDNLKDIILN